MYYLLVIYPGLCVNSIFVNIFFNLKETFVSDSLYWDNNITYKVENGLEGGTRLLQTPSYWNTPFTKICLGMKVVGGAETDTKWIAIHHQASSLFDVIADGNFTTTNISKSKWKSLIDDSTLQQYCNIQGFNIRGGYYYRRMYVRIGLVANNVKHCNTCNSCIGFGASITGSCNYHMKKKACGSIHACGHYPKNIAAFGYILVQ